MQDAAGQHDIPEVVTQCVITESHVQPDGRISIEVTGEARAHYSSTWEQDGYRMCRVQVRACADYVTQIA